MDINAGECFFESDHHELISLLYDGITNKQGFFPFLRKFVEVFEGHSASFSIYDTLENSLLGAWTLNIPDEAFEFYAEHVSHRDVLVQKALEVRKQGQLRFVASNLDLGPDIKRIRKETRVEEWLESYGADEAAGAIAFLDGHYMNFFGMQRSAAQPAFTREELSLFNRFLPHVIRSVDLYTRMLRGGVQPTAEQLALNHVDRGLLVVDTTYRVVFKNALADEILEKSVGFKLNEKSGVVSYQDPAGANQFSCFLTRAVNASLEGRDIEDGVFHVRRRNINLTVVISALQGADDSVAERGGVLISIYDWNHQPALNTQLVKTLFGLTEAELRVAEALLCGNSLVEIADTLSRSRETVKTHLNALFRKTDTRRQGELISLLSRSSFSS
ncbi:helix-turn-helix transcriptional regulator [uncultured Marinobacter sp.]|uniref:helix-turn-helix transcriptional regulator n=1 Tax=uncultured Marinobacter sp. TaxID=187379 RepID=UPI00261E927B|nr:helix-turn-helix transcriptional regulator [uncultured Marinobacter sp.]